MDNPYINPANGVLFNKLGINDKEKLNNAESQFTSVRLRELNTNPLKGKFDFDHLCKVHEYIFQDVYKWAGKPRTTDMEKPEPLLSGASIEYEKFYLISRSANKVINDMKSVKWDKLDLAQRAEAFSSHMASLWKVHPFREGNTRTIINFCSDYAESMGIHIDRNMFKDNAGVVRDALVMANISPDIARPDILSNIIKISMQRAEELNGEKFDLMQSNKEENLSAQKILEQKEPPQACPVFDSQAADAKRRANLHNANRQSAEMQVDLAKNKPGQGGPDNR